MRKKWLTLGCAVVLALVCIGAALATSPIKLIVDGKEVKTDIAPQLVNGRVMVPVRWVVEALGCSVDRDGNARTVFIRSNKDKPGEEGLCTGVPALKRCERGELEEAEEAVGFRLWEPGYVPDGAVAEDEVFWATENGGSIWMHYELKDLWFGISQRFAAYQSDFEKELKNAENSGDCQLINVNGYSGYLMEIRPEPTDKVSKGHVKIRWFQDDFVFTIEGDLPLKEELLKVASSLKRQP